VDPLYNIVYDVCLEADPRSWFEVFFWEFYVRERLSFGLYVHVCVRECVF